MSMLSFSELVDGASVRICHIDNVAHLSVRDVIMVVCDKSMGDASKVWARISEEIKGRLDVHLESFKFHCEQPSRVITLRGAIQLIMHLPGNMAGEFREKACDIILRYMAGDESLVPEIMANAASAAPINVLARESLASESSSKRLQVSEDLLIEERMVALAERKAALAERKLALEFEGERRRLENERVSFENHQLFLRESTQLIAQFSEGGKLDARCTIMAKERAMGAAFLSPASAGGNQLALGDVLGEDGDPKSVYQIVIGTYPKATTGDMISIGGKAVKMYLATFHEKPGFNMAWVANADRPVNFYTRKAHSLVLEAAKEHFDEKAKKADKKGGKSGGGQ